VHVKVLRARRSGSAVEDDAIALDATNPAEPDDVLDAPELLDLAGAQRWASEHRRGNAGIDAKELVRRFEPSEQIVRRRRLCGCF
jgi:hypothetical protein